MKQRNLMLTAGIAVAGLMQALAPAALAGLPKAVDMAPKDAAIVIATPSLNQLDSNLSQLAAMIGWGEMTTPREALGAIGLRDGLNMNGSAAIYLSEVNIDEKEPAAVVILPVTNYDKLLGGFNVTPAAGGMPDNMVVHGETVYARDLGNGYAAFGPIADLVNAVDAKSGSSTVFKNRLGDTCMSALDGCDIIFMSDVEQLEPLIDEGISQIPPDQQGQIDQQQIEMFKEHTDMLVMGLRAGAMGAGFEFAMRFNDNAPFAPMLQGKGDSSKLMKSLPAGQMVMAFAMDYSHPGMKAMNEMNMQQQAQMGMGGMGTMLSEAFKTATGMAGVVQFNPAGLMGGGMLANTVAYYRSTDPQKFMDAVSEVMDTINVPNATFNVRENATSVDGVKVSEWNANVAPAGPGGMQMMQATTMLFGQPGIGGYMAPGNEGVYFTLSKNVGLLGSALAAGGADSIMSDAMIKQVADQLPSNRVAEGYLNALPILQQMLPMAAMMGIPMQGINLPNDLPPVGGSIEADNASVRMTAYAPTPVLKLSGELMEKARAMMPAPGAAGTPAQKDSNPPF